MQQQHSTATLEGTAVIFDLDDTLYLEAEYVDSARREIARRIASRYPGCPLTEAEMTGIMNEWPIHGPGAFDALYAALPADIASEATVLWMRRVYRSHTPDITLHPDVEMTLSELKNRGATLGIITDGRVETQSLKLHALGLSRFIDPTLMSISEAVGSDKYSAAPFMRMERLTPGCTRRIYVGDNLQKDFIWPNAMRWDSVMIVHSPDSRQLFAADIESAAPSHRPARVITALPDLLPLIS